MTGSPQAIGRLLPLAGLLFLLSGCGSEEAAPTARSGVMDLSDWSFEENGTVELVGDWTIYWNRLLSPEEAASAENTPLPGGETFRMPGTWNSWPNPESEVGGTGYATFVLKVLLPGSVDAAGLRIPNASTAYELWANGTPAASSGTVGTDREGSRPFYRIVTADVAAPENEVILVLQVSNFHHRRGGMWKSLLLGTPDQIETVTTVENMYDLLLLGSFLIMGLYNLFLHFVTESRPRSALLLSAMFGILAVRVALLGQMLATQLFPSFPWVLQLKGEYLTSHLVPVLFIWAVHSLFPDVLSRRVVGGIAAFAGLNAAVMLAVPVLAYSRMVLVYLVGVLLGLLYVAIAFIRKSLRGRRDALAVVAAILVFFFIIFGETIHYRELILSRDFAPFGFLITLLSGSSVHPTGQYLTAAIATLLVIFAATNLLVLRASHAAWKVTLQKPEPVGPDELKRRFGITPREAELLELVIQGLSNKDISERLFISEGTVKNHIHSLMTKMGVRNRTELAWEVGPKSVKRLD